MTPTRASRICIMLALVSGLSAGRAGAHEATAAAAFEGGWTLDPWILAPLLISALLYAVGTARLWTRLAPGRGIRLWQAAAFAFGWLSLVAALVSPLHALGDISFSAHMAVHELLIVVAPPLLVFSRPLGAFLWALPPATRRSIGGLARIRWLAAAWRAAVHPAVAWAVHGQVLWLWHMPALFEAALRSEAIHTLQHASFLLSALLFWWAVLRRPRASQGYGAAILYLFTTSMHGSLLGALLTFSPHLWYPANTSGTAVLGLSPLADQQLAGLVMWVPGGIAYLAAALALFWLWLGQVERRTGKSARRIPVGS